MNSKIAFLLLSLIPTIGNAQTKTYSNSDNKYRIEYSADWILRERNGSVNLYAPVEDPSDKDYENLGINISPADGMTVDQCYTSYVKELPSALSEFQKVGEGSWDINDAKARWLECSFKDGTKSITNIICLFVKNDVLFILVGYSSTAKYTDHKARFVAMIKSFKLE